METRVYLYVDGRRHHKIDQLLGNTYAILTPEYSLMYPIRIGTRITEMIAFRAKVIVGSGQSISVSLTNIMESHTFHPVT